MIFVTDASGQTIHASAEWPNLTGQSVGDALGRGWLVCVHPDDREIVEGTLEAALSQVTEFSMRYRLVTASGTYRWVSVGCVPSIGPPEHTFIGYLGSLTELAAAAAGGLRAYGNVGRLIPPPTHSPAPSEDQLDRIADHLIVAHALIEGDGAQDALPDVRRALFKVGRALAARTSERVPFN